MSSVYEQVERALEEMDMTLAAEAIAGLLADAESRAALEDEGRLEEALDALVSVEQFWTQTVVDLAAEAEAAGDSLCARTCATLVLDDYAAGADEDERLDAIEALGILVSLEEPLLPDDAEADELDSELERARGYRALARAASDGAIEPLEALLDAFFVRKDEGDDVHGATSCLVSWLHRT